MATNLINALKFGDNNYNFTLPYGVCENAATDYAMSVTVDNATLTLEEGARIAVQFTNTPNIQASKTPTLQVNGLNAATIKAHGSTLSADYYWAPGQVVELIYADNAWHVLGAPTNNTYTFTTSNPTLAWGTESTIGKAGGVTYKVTMPANPNTDTKVTSVDNHYSPSANSASQLSADASSTTAASWGTTDLVTGVNIQRDAKGHVTGVTVDSIQMPANPDTNSAHGHSAGIGLVGSGNAGTSGTYTYKAALVNETKSELGGLYYSDTAANAKLYAVQLDKDGKLSVNVPWYDTVYSSAGSSLGLVKSGGDVTISSGIITITDDSHNHSASTITGTLNTSHIPSLAASKITSGTFDAARIPNLDASKITTGTIDAARLPSYVDDVLEGNYYANGVTGSGNPEFVLSGAGSTAVTPESGKVYVDTATNKTYRWSGSQFTLIASDLALGETSSTAYRGDRGAAAYKHAVTNKGSAYASGFYKITTNAEGHVTGATAVTKADITSLGIPSEDTNTAHKHTVTGKGLTLSGEGGTSGTTTLALDLSYYATKDNAGFMSQAMFTKLAGIADNANNYSLPVAASGTRGGIKIGYTASGANVPVALSNEQAYVALTKSAVTSALGFTPTANTGDITGVTAGSGLTGGATSGTATLNVGAGTGIVVNDNDVALDLTYLANAEHAGLMSATYYTFLTAHKHSASYTPAGSISQPTFTASNSITAVTGIKSASTSVAATSSTTTVKSLASGGSLTGSCSNKCLTLTFTAATSSSVTVPTAGHIHTATTGVEVNTSKYTPTGTVSKPTFTGTAATITTGAGSN